MGVYTVLWELCVTFNISETFWKMERFGTAWLCFPPTHSHADLVAVLDMADAAMHLQHGRRLPSPL